MPQAQKNSRRIASFNIPLSYKTNENRERFRDALNVFSNQDRLETRFGRSLFNATLLPGPVLSMSYFKNSSNVGYVIVKVGTTLYSVTSTTSTAIKTGLSASTRHRGVTWARGASSRHIIAIESDGLFQFDGTTFTQLGQDAPDGWGIDETTGTIPDGEYRVHLTFYSSKTGFETNSAFSPVFVISGGPAGTLVEDIPLTAANATIDKVRIYLQNLGNGDSPLLVTEQPLGTASYSISEIPGSNITPPLSNAMPVTGGGKYLVDFNGKLVYAGNNNFKNDVFFSEDYLPDAFNDGRGPNRNVLYASGNGDITGLAVGMYNNSVLDPYLVVFKKRSTEVYSEINGEGRVVTISKEIGCVSHDTISVKNGNVYFLSDQGWREIVNGQLSYDQTGNVATLGNGDIDDIFKWPGFEYEINRQQASSFFSVYYSTLDQYITWVAEGSSINKEKAYCFEFKVGGFKPYKFFSPATAACTGEDSNGNEVVFMGDGEGAIYTHSIRENRSDEDSEGTARPIPAFGMLSWFGSPDLSVTCNFRELFLRSISSNNDLTVRAFINFSLEDSFDYVYKFNNSLKSFVLDQSQLDVHSFGDERNVVTSKADINLCGEVILIGFYQNYINSNINLISAQVDFSTNGNSNR